MEVSAHVGPPRWYQLLSDSSDAPQLVTSGGSGPQGEPEHQSSSVLAKLQAALEAASADESPGVKALLQRAVTEAERGATTTAWRTARSACDFQRAFTAYRNAEFHKPKLCSPTQAPHAEAVPQAAGGQHHGQDGTHTTTSSGTSDVTNTELPQHGSTAVVAQLQPAQQSGAPQDSGLERRPSTNSTPRPVDGTFAVPPPPKRRRVPAVDVQPVRAVNTGVLSENEWNGVLGLMSEDSSRVSDLCQVSLQLPTHAAAQLPRALHLTHLAQRRGVTMGQYQVVRTTITRGNTRQISRLRSMAQHELVAVMMLPAPQSATPTESPATPGHLIVVPYLDNLAHLRLVSFMLLPSTSSLSLPAPALPAPVPASAMPAGLDTDLASSEPDTPHAVGL